MSSKQHGSWHAHQYKLGKSQNSGRKAITINHEATSGNSITRGSATVTWIFVDRSWRSGRERDRGMQSVFNNISSTQNIHFLVSAGNMKKRDSLYIAYKSFMTKTFARYLNALIFSSNSIIDRSLASCRFLPFFHWDWGHHSTFEPFSVEHGWTQKLGSNQFRQMRHCSSQNGGCRGRGEKEGSDGRGEERS